MNGHRESPGGRDTGKEPLMSKEALLTGFHRRGGRALQLAARAGTTVLVVCTTLVLVTVPAWADDVTVTPSGSALGGGATKVQTILNLLGQGALWASLASLLLGAGVWGLSKHFGNYGTAHKGMILALGGGAGALLTSMAPQIVNGLFKA
jgi:hypothetical protein